MRFIGMAKGPGELEMSGELRDYIMWLETDSDPAGSIRENYILTMENRALRKILEEKETEMTYQRLLGMRDAVVSIETEIKHEIKSLYKTGTKAEYEGEECTIENVDGLDVCVSWGDQVEWVEWSKVKPLEIKS